MPIQISAPLRVHTNNAPISDTSTSIDIGGFPTPTGWVTRLHKVMLRHSSSASLARICLTITNVDSSNNSLVIWLTTIATPAGYEIDFLGMPIGVAPAGTTPSLTMEIYLVDELTPAPATALTLIAQTTLETV